MDLIGDDRAMIYGALLWMADKLKNEQGEHARALWTAKGKKAFDDGYTPNRSRISPAFAHSSPGIRSISSFITLTKMASSVLSVSALARSV